MITLGIVALALIAAVLFRPALAGGKVGKILIFLALFTLPLMATFLGATSHVKLSKTTEFCLSCHAMEPYGQSLWLDDMEHLPASHYQNNRIPRDHACYTCHTSYTMFGDFQSKLRGLRHVYVHYLGTIPEKIELYEPYNNRECLYCHRLARSFQASELHQEMSAEFAANEVSCLDCHVATHAVDELQDAELWKPRNK